MQENIEQDNVQFEQYNRLLLDGGDGFLFVRFVDCTDSTDEWTVEHCVSEGGWHSDTNGVLKWGAWECPCDGCHPWRPKWRHLFAALWGAKRVYDLADSYYSNFSVPTEEEWNVLDLEEVFSDAGKSWECIQWEDGMCTTPPEQCTTPSPSSTSISQSYTSDSDGVSSMSGSIPSHGYTQTLTFSEPLSPEI
jgi:hypothetical protein